MARYLSYFSGKRSTNSATLDGKEAFEFFTDAEAEGVIPNNHVIVKSLSDFPTPVANIITLADNTAYLINGTVDISPNRIVTGIRTTIGGEDKQNDILLSDTTSTLITMDSSSVNKIALTFNTCTLKAVNGTLFNITSSTQRNVFVIDNCNLTSSTNIGTLNNFTSFVMRNSAFLNASASGVTITGTNGTFRVRDGNYATVTGTCFAFGTATCTSIGISRNLITVSGGNTFLSGTTGGANVTLAGLLHDNVFDGAGTYVATITGTDTNWLWTANVGVTNTPVTATTAWGTITGTLASQTDLQTALDAKLVKANNLSDLTNASTARTNLGLGTLATQSGTFSGTSSGTNTGDNATNSQYSGLATSKQDTLVSGTNIKTVNGASLLGSGNLAISGGSITATSIDTGSTPKMRHQITITDATVSASSKIMLNWGQVVETDENSPEMDDVSFRTIAGTGQFDVVIASQRMIRGIFKANYTVAI